MTTSTFPYALRAAVSMLALAALPAFAAPPAPQEFAWRAPLELPAGASLVRVAVPGPALARLQGADARDLRVFNAAGEAVAFAFTRQPAAPAVAPAYTQPYNALALYSAAASAVRPASGALRVRIEDGAQQRSVWMQVDGQAPKAAGAERLDSVIFATRAEKQRLSGLKVQAALPANAPVRVSASSSPDLASWTPLPVRGRLYRFDGDGAPANDVLEFDAPVSLEDRYLRLDWSGQPGVSVSAVAGIVAPATPQPQREQVALAAPRAEGRDTLEWSLPFATRIAALALSTPRANTLLPVRILGRTDAAQPWRPIGQAVVYRLGGDNGDAVNPPVPLYGASARWLRVVSANGADLETGQLRASALFDPVQIVFVASGSPPFELAAGRAATPAAALPLPTLAGTLGTRKVDDLPLARVGAAVAAPLPEPAWFARWLPAGLTDKAAVLWAVLIAGVLLLGAVAWGLLRQLKAPPAE